MKNIKKLLSILFISTIALTSCSINKSSSINSASSSTSEHISSSESSSSNTSSISSESSFSSSNSSISSSTSSSQSSSESSSSSSSSSSSENESSTGSSTQEVDWSNLSYAAFGDSITKGTNLFESSGLLSPSYPEEVKNILNLKSFSNYGVAGADLCYINKNFSSISNNVLNLTEHYDIISVNGGVNDWNCDNPLGTINDMNDTTIYGSLNLIGEYLTTKCSDSFYFFITPYNCKLKQGQYDGYTGYNCNKLGYSLEDVATAYKKVAIKYNIPVLDFFTNGNYEDEMYNDNSDGVHPNQDFVLEYTAPQISQFIKDNYKVKQHINFSNLVVNCLGDSLTEGLIANGSKMEKPYSAQLNTLLGCKKVNNYGMGGSMLSLTGGYSMCERYDDMENADIIMVMGGTNDALSFGWNQGWKATLGTINDTDESTVYGSLDVICKGLKQIYPNSFIFFITPFELADGYEQWCLNNSGFTLNEVCIAIKTVCARYDIPVFDAYKLCSFKEQANYDYINGLGDGIHPRQEFIDSFSIQLSNYIKNNYPIVENTPLKESIKGKNISFMGDSISTYMNWNNNPSYNSTIGPNYVYYTGSLLGNVDNTWWKKTVDDLELNLCVNNSWSGSRVSATAGNEAAACMNRSYNLHNDHENINPDIIVILIGINDLGSNVPIGSFNDVNEIYDSKTNTYNGDLTNIADSYATMLHKITTYYEYADVYCCTMFNFGSNTGALNDTIRSVANYFDCKIIDFAIDTDFNQHINAYTLDTLHPNEAGMSVMAECVKSNLMKYYY